MTIGSDVRFPLLPEVISAQTSDVYFLRARDILRELGCDPVVGMEIFPSRSGIFCGVGQVHQLLVEARFDGEVRSLAEGDTVASDEAAMEIYGRYSTFGVYETAILGILASCSGWATAARAAVDAATPIPVVSFGARHLHPNVAPLMDFAAVIGGCSSCSTTLGAILARVEASGTMPHAYVLVVGDTLRAAEAFDRIMPPNIPRIVLVDTFQDEAVESLHLAQTLSERLDGVRLDTPAQRGGVTPALVAEVRARLDLAGFPWVKIVVSGGVTPDRIVRFLEDGAPVDSFGVGSFISGAAPITFTGDIRSIEGTPVAKRGRIPGMAGNQRLKRIL